MGGLSPIVLVLVVVLVLERGCFLPILYKATEFYRQRRPTYRIDQSRDCEYAARIEDEDDDEDEYDWAESLASSHSNNR